MCVLDATKKKNCCFVFFFSKKKKITFFSSSKLNQNLRTKADTLCFKNRYDGLLPSDADKILEIWRSEEIQQTWEIRSDELQLPDGLKRLIPRVHIIVQEDYIPTHDVNLIKN